MQDLSECAHDMVVVLRLNGIITKLVEFLFLINGEEHAE